MRKIYLKMIALSLGLFLVLFAASGCARVNRNVQQPGQNIPIGQNPNLMGRNNQGNNINMNPGLGNNVNTNPGLGNNLGINNNRQDLTGDLGYNNLDNNGVNYQANQTGFDRQRAERIRNGLINTLDTTPGNVIVNGNTCLVGYTPNGATRDLDTVRDTITRRVKQIDPNITRVVVSDVADINTRMNQLTNDLTNGTGNNVNNMNELNTRFNQLIRDINTPNR